MATTIREQANIYEQANTADELVVGSDTFASLLDKYNKMLTTLWLLITGVWTLYFLHGLIDSRSVIVAVEQGLGRPIGDFSAESPQVYDVLAGAFCGHGFEGESVNSTFTNWIMLTIGGFVTYVVALPLFLGNMFTRRPSKTSRRAMKAMVGIAVVQVALMVLFKDTISLATYFGD